MGPKPKFTTFQRSGSMHVEGSSSTGVSRVLALFHLGYDSDCVSIHVHAYGWEETAECGSNLCAESTRFY